MPFSNSIQYKKIWEIKIKVLNNKCKNYIFKKNK